MRYLVPTRSPGLRPSLRSLLVLALLFASGPAFEGVFTAQRAAHAAMMGPMPMNPPANCMLSAPAFCDNFQVASPGGRAGDLDDGRWSFARLSHHTSGTRGLYDKIYPTTRQFCRTTLTGAVPPQDSFFCNGNGQEVSHWMDSLTSSRYGGGYQLKDVRIRQPFDFAGRTGKIVFDVDTKNSGGSQNATSSTSWIETWITQEPVPGPHNPLDDLGAIAVKNAIGLSFNNDCGHPQKEATLGQIDLFNNYRFHLINVTPISCVKTQADMFNHFEVRLSQTGVEVWASDYSPDHGGTFPNFRLIARVTGLNLLFTRGYVHIQHAQYGLYNASPTSITYHWLGIGFDGPVLPTDRAYDIPDAMTAVPPGFFAPGINVGYGLPTDGSSGMRTCCTPGTSQTNVISPFMLDGVDLSNVSSASLNLDMYMYQPCWAPGKVTLRYRFNGGTWRDYLYPSSDCVQSRYRALSVPVAPSDLRNGTNTLELSSYGDPTHPPVVANIDLMLQGNFAPLGLPPSPPAMMGVPVPNPYPAADPSLTAYMQLLPSTGTYPVGAVFPVQLHIDGGGKAFNAASATVSLSPNLSVQSIRPGDCNMAAIPFPQNSPNTVPTVSDPSFGGTMAGKPSSCTVYTLDVKVVGSGPASITITSGSVQSAKGSAEILTSSTVSASYNG